MVEMSNEINGLHYVAGELRMPPAAICNADGIYISEVLGVTAASQVLGMISRYDKLGYEEGRMSAEELQALRGLVDPIINDLPVSALADIEGIAPLSSVGPANPIHNAPWSRRNEEAINRLPNTGGIFSKTIRKRLWHRGPGRYNPERRATD